MRSSLRSPTLHFVRRLVGRARWSIYRHGLSPRRKLIYRNSQIHTCLHSSDAKTSESGKPVACVRCAFIRTPPPR